MGQHIIHGRKGVKCRKLYLVSGEDGLKVYLATLNTRFEWVEETKDLKTDDIVLVLESNLPRGRWPLGRIIETFPGKDVHNRVAKVQVGEKT
jgi:hypothetical protein